MGKRYDDQTGAASRVTFSGERMRKVISSLPRWAEFVIVILVAFGWITFTSVHSYLFGVKGFHASSYGLSHLAALEAALIIILGYFLYARGWTLKKVGLTPTWTDTAVGIALALAVYLIYRMVRYGCYVLFPSFMSAMVVRHSGSSAIAITAILAMLAVNPLFEEFFVAGYVITFLKEKGGATLAVNASLTIRVLYHLYQGVGGLLNIVPMGLLFGIWYVRSRRLWPLVVGHAALQLYAYLRYFHFW